MYEYESLELYFLNCNEYRLKTINHSKYLQINADTY